MALFSRQAPSPEIIDDQNPIVAGIYTGNWSLGHAAGLGFNNDTCTFTPTPGASLSYTFSGSQITLYGYPPNSTTAYPTADYTIDGVPYNQIPFRNANGYVYFYTPKLADGTHTINATVKTANDALLYYVDYFVIVPNAGGSSGASPTQSVSVVATKPVPVGPIVGGVVGGIAAIVLLVIAVWFLLSFLDRRSRGGPAYSPEKPGTTDVLGGEGHVLPYNPTAGPRPESSAQFSVPGTQTAYSDGSSNQPLNPTFRQTVVSSHQSQYNQPGPGEFGPTYYVSGNSAQPRTGNTPLVAQQYGNVQRPAQYQDPGMRFAENPEQGPGSSRAYSEVPPTYFTSN